jgi:hypothetical protein
MAMGPTQRTAAEESTCKSDAEYLSKTYISAAFLIFKYICNTMKSFVILALYCLPGIRNLTHFPAQW